MSRVADDGPPQRKAATGCRAGCRGEAGVEAAYALCSVAVDLRISEVVDAPNWVVSAFLPLDLFGPLRPGAG